MIYKLNFFWVEQLTNPNQIMEICNHRTTNTYKTHSLPLTNERQTQCNVVSIFLHFSPRISPVRTF
ncbi:hypothetical protein Pint_14459 [Pistacia integerrima]|uniref:Uncharacterized protein n=1 Tax=Pistacia integerrima TaxID=434235 RepID=A0ACC0Y740_9ROSI|nr:hypothetical protein Pint_14459 [Pistacia integerrima]